ncbi:cysteine/serine-rich nuclear protein 1 [Cricetulus griseus]|uniref:Cysteine/serine-rich nuclear protein 1 n=1 Tax=Cricetulus griseus TaxID=10029 RepID=A0A061I800_CRIGR|nr:cysteine/serine-rich nuclear protein 1 [Cricetulus griseus]
MAGLLKRKFDQLEEGFFSSSSSSSSSSGSLSLSSSPGSSVFPAWNSDEEGPVSQAPQPDQDFCSLQSFTPPSILKRAPRERPGHVTFDSVTVYYFPRCQGFTSVPSRGGCTLGMAPCHSSCRLFSLAEFTQEQIRARREKLCQRLKEEKLEMLRWKDGPIEQTLVSPFPLATPPVSSELSDNSCSSDMTDSSTSSSSGNSEPPDRLTHPSPPAPSFQSGVDEDSLAQILNFSDSDLGVEEEEEEERGVGNLDNLSCFHLADIFGTGDPSSLTSWTQGQSCSSLSSGILDENANLDASCFLNGRLEGLRGGSLPGSSGSPGAEAVQSGSVDLSLSSCDSFEFLQALPDYSLGPHYTSCRVSGSLDSHEALHPLPSFSPPRDTSACFLESLVGLSEPVTDVLAPLLESQFEDAALAPLMEPMPV